MTWKAITGVVPQYSTASNELASGYYLKFYLSGTTTPYSVATDSTGAQRLAKVKLNAKGMPITNPLDETTTFIPHADSDYRIVLYANEADADANNTAAAEFNVDGILQTASALTSAEDIAIRGTTLQAQNDYFLSPKFTDGDGFTAGVGPHVITLPSGWDGTDATMRFYRLDSSGVVYSLTPSATTSTTFTLDFSLLSTDTIFVGDVYFRALGTAATADMTTSPSDATAGRALATDSDVYRPANILGTVSETGGVPTGAVIESDTNANGEYVLFADGTAISTADFNESVTSGTNVIKDFAFAGFTSRPQCVWWAYRSGTISIGVNFHGPLNAAGGIINFNATATAVFGYIAVGRWN